MLMNVTESPNVNYVSFYMLIVGIPMVLNSYKTILYLSLFDVVACRCHLIETWHIVTVRLGFKRNFHKEYNDLITVEAEIAV
jgi:hypothetical protein